VTYELTGLVGDEVAIQAFPAEGATYANGGRADAAVVEAIGPLPSGKVTVGCLIPGASYEIALDIVGDTLGILVRQQVTAPST
jgi:hypothetical protein